MYHYGARFMDPVTGRFLTPDPVRDYINPYSYVGNNPVNRIDPAGMWAMSFTYGRTEANNNLGDLSWVDEVIADVTNAENGLIEWAETKFREELKKEILADGRITIKEAFQWLKEAGDYPLEVLLSDLRLFNVHPDDFPNGVGSVATIELLPLVGKDSWDIDDGLVYGSLNLRLGQDDQGFFVKMALNENGDPIDRFDFDVHALKVSDFSDERIKTGFKELVRNIEVLIFRMELNVWYTRNSGFDIYLQGPARIH